ncbi:MAG: (d)CMP kinase [Planctomycetota bacterium]
MPEPLVIAIDGPVGSGKSTVARRLADRLGFRYLDTGAMYRAVTLKALRSGADLGDPEALTAVARSSDIRLEPAPEGLHVLLDGRDVTPEIRSLEVTNNAFRPSQTPGVRERMVELQRREAERGPLVAEGRDMGTVVFTDSPAKFYLDASVEERARRRHAEHLAQGDDVSLAELQRQIVVRDRRDSTRRASPLRRAEDAVYVETTDMGVEDVVDHILGVLGEKGLLAG